MMQKKQILTALASSLLVGLLAVILATHWLSTSGRVSLVRVVVAAHALPTGATLTADDVKVTEVPSESVPRNAISGPAAAIDRVTQAPIQPGAVVLDSMLQPPHNALDLAQAIAPGMRAFSIHVDEESQVSGFVLPGNYVDVVLDAKDAGGQQLSSIVLQRLLVLAVAQDRLAPTEGKPKVVSSVTLQVSPAEAEQLDLARSVGSLTLVLRNQNDASVPQLEAASQRQLFAQPAALMLDASAPRRHAAVVRPASQSVQVIRGIAP